DIGFDAKSSQGDVSWLGTRANPRMIFSGMYGADRNANHLLDRGPVPASARMKAIEVARFTIYDPRLNLVTR
nr:hypothetical protein [Planctomycetota bacterium]